MNDDLIGYKFLIEWDDGSFSTATEARVSEMFDMADCNYMDHVEHVLAVGNDGKFHPVHTANFQHTGDEWDTSFWYGSADLVTEDGKTVGTVHYSDH